MCLCTVVLVLAQSWVGYRWSGECAIGNRGLPGQMQPNPRGDWGPLGHFLDFVKYLDSDKQYAYITYHN